MLPPLPEQRKIAAILSSVDDAIEKTQAVIDQVQVVKRGLMQELLTRGLPGRHTRFKQTEIGKVPEEWAIVRIIDVADVDYGISAAVSANTDPGIGWPILTGANLTLDGQIDLFKLVYHEPPSKERFYLRKNDLLLNWRSMSARRLSLIWRAITRMHRLFFGFDREANSFPALAMSCLISCVTPSSSRRTCLSKSTSK